MKLVGGSGDLQATPFAQFPELDRLGGAAGLPRARCEMVSSAMSELVAAYGLTHDEGCAFLVDDVVALRSIFSSIVDCGYVRPRLDVFQTNACRIFHLDAVMARLICTYRDHATQYDTGHAGEDPE